MNSKQGTGKEFSNTEDMIMINIAPYNKKVMVLALASGLLAACSETADLTVEEGTGPEPTLPVPEESFIPTVNVAEGVGWSGNDKPKPAQGLEVVAFAQNLDHPRWLYTLPNGDVLVAETNAPPRPEDGDGIYGWFMSKFMEKAGAAVPSADRITLLRDTDKDGVADQRTVFLNNLNSPFGMALVDNSFYVANTDAVMEFPYSEGDTRIEASGRVLATLPGGPLNHHWTKSLVASPDGSKLYVGVGSNSNVGENGMDQEAGRAAIWEIDRQTGTHRIYADGLRNPVGMTFVPETDELWVSVNERDALGSDLVPDYMTSVSEGGFYGWPYSYYGQHVDERIEPARPDLVEKAISPDYALGPHTASLGLLYVTETSLSAAFENGMFIGQHGSWNREPPSGYKVIFVEFANGEPVGAPKDVLSGFLEGDTAYGRPVGLTQTSDGSLLVADDVGNTVWHVSGANVRLSDAR